MAEPKARRTFNKKKTIVSIAIGLFLLALFLSFWFGAVGGGEYKDSPNGKYIARQSLYTQRTLLNGEIQYVGIEVEEKATGKVIWEMTYRPPAGSNPYLYGDRSREFFPLGVWFVCRAFPNGHEWYGDHPADPVIKALG